MFDMGRQPMSLVALQEDPRQSEALERHSIQLAICRSCSHVYNMLFNPAHVTYSAAGCRMFNDGSGWQEHMDNLRKKIEELKDIDLLVEIGAGDCEFLNSIKTSAVKLAVDPCEAVCRAEEFGIQYTRAHFDPQLHMPKSSQNTVILMRHLLEHMEHPRDFIERIVRRAETMDHPTAIIIEVPCCQKALQWCRIEDWTYEHPQNFTVSSLHKLLRACDVYRCHVETSYDGEVAIAIAVVEPKKPRGLQASTVLDSYRRVQDNIEKYSKWMNDNLQDIIFWGGAGKSAMFLNRFKIKDRAVVVDSHHGKWGFCVPGKRTIIRSPDFLSQREHVRYIIATTSWRANDIANEITQRQIKCEKLLKFENGDLVEVPLGQN